MTKKKKVVKKKSAVSKDLPGEEVKRIWVKMDAITTDNLKAVKEKVCENVPFFFQGGRALSDSAIICGLINRTYQQIAEGKFSIEDSFSGPE
jgi:hypothetical protein